MDSIIQFLITQITVFLNTFITPLVKQAWSLLMTPINLLFYEVFKLFLMLMDALQDAVGAFSGARPISFFGEDAYLIDLVFFGSELSVLLWGVTFVGVILAGYFTIASMRKSAAGNVPVGKTLAAAGKSMLTLLLLPLLMIVGLRGASILLNATSSMLGTAMGGEGSVKVSGMVFAAATMGAEDDTYFTEDVRTQYITAQLDYTDSEMVFHYFNAGEMHFAVGMLLSLYFVVIYGIVCLLFIGRCIQLLLLYLAAPYYAAFIPLDERKFTGWRDSFIAKLASGFGLVIALEVFGLFIVPLFASGAVQFSGSVTADFVFRMLFIAGSAFAITRCYTVLIEVLNPQLAYQERMYGDAVENTVKLAAATAVTVASGGSAGAAMAGSSGASSSSMMAQQMLQQAAQATKNVAANSE